MKAKHWLAIVLTFTFGSQLMAAQAPSGFTGQCKDGTYTTAAKKSGACSGHKGVQSWFAAAGSAPATTNAVAPGQEPIPAGVSAPEQTLAPSAPSAATAPAQSSPTGQEPTPSADTHASTRPSSSSSAPRTQAAGGGPGMVWVNTSSKVYHCPGTQFYGTTKNGKYMSESDATAMGARADHNKPCPK